MIAKILGTSSSFPAIKYNDSKIEKNKGELLELVNFPFSELDMVTQKELKSFLDEASIIKKNENFKMIQFHATISCKGKEYDKSDLKDISKQWMEGMGYKNQPYVIVFHNDTKNNHVHIVSTRVDIETGKKINDSNEGYQARREINKIIEQDYGTDQKFKNENKISNLLDKYSFDTFNSLKTFLNSENQKIYVDKEDRNILNVYNSDWQGKFKLDQLNFDFSLDSISKKKYQALFYKYKEKTNNDLFGFPCRNNKTSYKYNSDFIEGLKTNFGLEIRPIIKNGSVSNYILIDHKNKTVLNGNSIMNAKVLFNTDIKTLDISLINNLNKLNIDSKEKLDALCQYYDLPKFALDINYENRKETVNSIKTYLKNNPDSDIHQFAENIGGSIFKANGETYYLNTKMNLFENINSFINLSRQEDVRNQMHNSINEENNPKKTLEIFPAISSALNTYDEDGHIQKKHVKTKKRRR